MNINPGILVEFEGNEFRHCIDAGGDSAFDTWVLKSKGNRLKFDKEGFYVEIITCKFPHGFYGFGYSGNSLHDNDQCYCHGALGRKTFKTEFEAQCAAIKYIFDYNQIVSGWNQHFVKLQMQDFINPKTLF